MMNHVNVIAMRAQNLEEEIVKDNIAEFITKILKNRVELEIKKQQLVLAVNTCTTLFSHHITVLLENYTTDFTMKKISKSIFLTWKIFSLFPCRIQ